MKIAILGSKGFIGSYLQSHFWSSKYKVIPVTRDTLDLLDYSQVQFWLLKNRPDVVINCAISGGGTTVNEINFQDAQQNITVFFNFFNSAQSFRYINIGSGAEFDKSMSINEASEFDIFYRLPKDSYGYSKNIISRAIRKRDNFYTLRLFGCFGSTEPAIRLFKKFLSHRIDYINDRYFDYFSVWDFAKVVEYYCNASDVKLIKDINCVYPKKLLLSEILSKLNKVKNIDLPIYTDGTVYNSYTGSTLNLLRLCNTKDFPVLDGLEKGLEVYE